MQDLSTLELTYCVAVLLFTFALRGSLGFGGAVGLPLLALVIPVKILAPAWSLVGIVSSAWGQGSNLLGSALQGPDPEFAAPSASPPAFSFSSLWTPCSSRARSA